MPRGTYPATHLLLAELQTECHDEEHHQDQKISRQHRPADTDDPGSEGSTGGSTRPNSLEPDNSRLGDP